MWLAVECASDSHKKKQKTSAVEAFKSFLKTQFWAHSPPSTTAGNVFIVV